MEAEADEPSPAIGKKSKITRDTADAPAETPDVKKTEAQLERARRKKQQQKAKKRNVAQD